MSPRRQEIKVGCKRICEHQPQHWVGLLSPSTECHHSYQSFRAAATALELNSMNREVST